MLDINAHTALRTCTNGKREELPQQSNKVEDLRTEIIHRLDQRKYSQPNLKRPENERELNTSNVNRKPPSPCR